MTREQLQRGVVIEVRRWIGTPYIHQASVAGYGCDCLGLVRGVWRHLYGTEPENVPAYSPDWGDVSGNETLLEAANRWLDSITAKQSGPGDVLLFRLKENCVAKHIGIMTGVDAFVHACSRLGVVESRLGISWRRRIAATYRFPLNAN